MKKVRTGLTLAVLLLSSIISTMAFASVSDDQVTSQKIKEADGTSGQNTNSGSGVKTGHIQNGAVTTSKIAVSAVTSSVIANGAITSATIADGAVTDAKITGPISASKISSTGLNADTVDGLHASAFAPVSHTQAISTITGLDAALAGKADVTHSHDTLYQQKYGKIAVVAITGGDYTNPVAAMNDIATWCGTPSATNPCLLKIMPGYYDIGGNTILATSFVDIEGSGRYVTKIFKAVGGPIIAFGNVTDSALRNISLESYGEQASAGSLVAVSVGSSQNIVVSDSDLKVTGGNEEAGMSISGSSNIAIRNTSIFVDALFNKEWRYQTWGIIMSNSSAELENVKIDARFNIDLCAGIWMSENNSIVIRSSIISGGRYGLAQGLMRGTSWSGNTAEIYNSTMTGGDSGWAVIAGIANGFGVKFGNGFLPAGIKCISCFNSSFDPL